jgi:hypothetical protein
MVIYETAADAAAAHVVPEAIRWSRTALIAFRFAIAAAVLSFFHLLGFTSNYLFFDRVRQSFDRWVAPIGNTEFRIAKYIGASALRLVTGSPGTLEEITARYRYPVCYLCAVVLVAAATAGIWTVADRRRTHYVALNRWLRVYARYTLALVMMVYALVKVVPTQFGFLTPGELLRPVGQLTRFWVLWNFMVVSTGYTIFAGLVELLGCVLLLFRRTTLMGALLLGAALTNVLAMDIAYNVLGAAMVAGILIMLAIVIVAPYTAPLMRVLFLGRADYMPAEPITVLARWRYALPAKILLLVLLVSVRVSDGLAQRRSYFGRSHAVYGMFDVDRFSRNGAPVTPLANDSKTWKRVASDGRYDGAALSVQYASGDVRQYRFVDDPANRVWTLREGSTIVATLRYSVAADGSVSLDGHIGADAVQLSLRPMDMQALPLLRR